MWHVLQGFKRLLAHEEKGEEMFVKHLEVRNEEHLRQFSDHFTRRFVPYHILRVKNQKADLVLRNDPCLVEVDEFEKLPCVTFFHLLWFCAIISLVTGLLLEQIVALSMLPFILRKLKTLLGEILRQLARVVYNGRCFGCTQARS